MKKNFLIFLFFAGFAVFAADNLETLKKSLMQRLDMQTVEPKIAAKAKKLEAQYSDLTKKIASQKKIISDSQKVHEKISLLNSNTTPKEQRYKGWQYDCNCDKHKKDNKVQPLKTMPKKRGKKKKDKECKVKLVPVMSDEEMEAATEKADSAIAEAIKLCDVYQKDVNKVIREYRDLQKEFRSKVNSRIEALEKKSKK